MSYPKDFLWGAATSAFQYEGAADEDDKGWSVADERCSWKKQQQADTLTASDGYHHVEEDVMLMKKLGLRSYRFSISWARLYPDGDGELNWKGISYYQRLIQLLNENQIEPIVTLLHFDIPWALVQNYEGFLDRRCVEAFERYCRTCFELFGSQVKYWLTINEQNIMAMMPEMCGISNEDPDRERKLAQINYHMYLANAKAVILCHRLLPGAMIGPCVSYPTLYPETCHPKDIAIAYEMEERMAFAPMETYVYGMIPAYVLKSWEKKGYKPKQSQEDMDILKMGVADYLGVNWYCTQTVGMSTQGVAMNIGVEVKVKQNPYLEYGEWGWSYDPKAFKMALKECYARYRKPIMVCENGWSEIEELEGEEVHDQKRIAYLRDHINSMKEAIEEGVPVIGYQHWSFMDILSSSQGFEKRYGLIYVDREEFDMKQCKRYPKDSFYEYQKIIQLNGNLSELDKK